MQPLFSQTHDICLSKYFKNTFFFWYLQVHFLYDIRRIGDDLLTKRSSFEEHRH